jgi:hypothetical protein
MGEDPREFRAGAVEGDAALAQEGAGVGGPAAVAEVGDGFDADGLAGERREASKALFTAEAQRRGEV